MVLGISSLCLGLLRTHADARTTDSGFEAAYRTLHRTGELHQRAESLRAMMEHCELCPRKCGVNRLAGAQGFCRSPGATLMIASAHPHFGEEKPLVGHHGSETIFFTHCGMRCVFCQNWDISHLGWGMERSEEDLATMMLDLQQRGCHNINLVTPTHYSASIIRALDIAAGRGLRVPIVYNTCGWERLEILKLLDGVVDIYLPDFKYWDRDISIKYSAGADDYPGVTREEYQSVVEKAQQLGLTNLDVQGYWWLRR